MKQPQKSTASLALLAVGIVYGDIGTSPLYALKEVFFSHHPLPINSLNVLGILSLVFWTFVLIVSVKYLMLITRAHKHGEGGILTLSAIAREHCPDSLKPLVLLLGLLATGFFFGEAVITPAMSVLSAVEGIAVVEQDFAPFVLPIAVGIIVILFAIQALGTERIGRFFAPVMVIWFLSLGVLGFNAIIEQPQVLVAINPYYAFHFIAEQGVNTLIILGVVVLSVTGVEALYADMGHIGIKPIRLAWFMIVLPSLLLNYFGQGAYLLVSQGVTGQTFFGLVPNLWLWPVIILATLAAVIASQAVISGIFSLTRQAMNYGYLPPLKITHTSEHSQGQIYVPAANVLLFVAVLFVMMRFQSSANLAAAYGIAVTAIMTISSLLIVIVARYYWQWHRAHVWLLGVIFVSLDVFLFVSTSTKLSDGGWLPISLGGLIFAVMSIWQQQKQRLLDVSGSDLSLSAMIASLEGETFRRTQGNAVYLSRVSHHVPRSLVHNLKYNKTLHERNILMTFQYESQPKVHPCRRAEIEQLSETFWQVIIHTGYQEVPDIEQVMHSCSLKGLHLHPNETIFLLSAERIQAQKVGLWHDFKARLFILMSKHALRTAERLNIPSDRLIEMGVYREI
ncbi:MULTISPECIES: potassium transporter Kup [unclassified Vibrio]|uniref:potassium transporter Kup n=1 Tax=unclassified Vibrio TaxID=2614977 RepID=UPI000B8ECC0F|nr:MULTISPECIES: potassium transporter Kup [unclassified Vibrio]NAW91286.1 potassium transporter Kup [Vibrio sp. V24_P1S3T111]OXX21913.1 potassium transporter Kup [Vibrio sp. V05_P4A8T149]OXX25640.1 potassium transporter Kup [Vibrio sp. V06_P1A73T115]OXX29824.1 potassium transporter Kup [Vibrio sp. V14_P6S14T42]OXX30584.1 potassium transporter Kup [Vibrio sp. V04_P4A5T148]